MADQPTDPFSETDVQSLGQKLADFSQTLTPGEQAVLTELLQQAMPHGDDVRGFSYDPHGNTIERKLLIVGLLDILYPDDFDSMNAEPPSEAQSGGTWQAE